MFKRLRESLRGDRPTIAFTALAFILLLNFAVAQIPAGVSGKKVSYSHYEGSVPRALITAQNVKPLSGKNILALEFMLTTFRDGNPTNIEVVIESPECVFNYDSHLASSTNRLILYNAETNLLIEGRGFVWQPGPTNVLTISNDVHTIIQRVTNAPVKNEGALHIYSDHFKFLAVLGTNANTRIAYYTDNVRAEDPDVRLTAASLTADLSGTNNVKNIVAETNVVIVHKEDNSEAAGERAVYVNEGGKQLVELTGNPHWHDTKNEGRAKRFRYDRNSRMVWLEGDAEMKLPRNSVAQPEFLGLNSKKEGKTNEPITISARVLQIDLTTNKTGRVLVAQTNVVILADNTRATADSAFFSEASGVLRLTNGTWGGDQFTATGALLTLDRSNKVFHAEHDAFLKLPAKSFGEVKKKSKAADDRSIEILADHYDVHTNFAVFHDNVRASFPAQLNGIGHLTCDQLTAQFRSNKVQTLIAEGHVDLQQKVSDPTNAIDRQVTCEKLTVKFLPNGSIQVLHAEVQVIAEEFSHNLKTKVDRKRKLSASSVDIQFGATNQIGKLVADRNVYLEENRSWGQGERLVYTNSGEEEVAELIGNPKVLLIQKGKKAPLSMTGEKEEEIIWNLKTEVARVTGMLKAHPVAPTNSVPTKKR
ncbi:MAG: hypothetical protein JWM68_1808 [Verrucomicrobiales bacterium]|nr:hypothetical protein [Verrucomicrobiales bacterium]